MKLPKNRMAHYANVAKLGCIITGGPCEIHHCHGRSVGARLVFLGMDGGNGTSMRGYSDALVIPLCPEYHRGKNGVDRIGVDLWEATNGDQVKFLEEVSERVGYDLFELHRSWVGTSKLVPRRSV